MFTEVKGLRMLWATPAASLPTMAHFPDCSRCSWLRVSSRLGLVHVLDEAVYPAAQGLHFIRHPAPRVGRGVSRPAAESGPRICLMRIYASNTPKIATAGIGHQGKGVDEPALGLALGPDPGNGVLMQSTLYRSQRFRMSINWRRTSQWRLAPASFLPSR